MIKTVIFDMDGLMIDSERVTYDGYVQELQKYGIDFPLERYKLFLGKQVPIVKGYLKEWYGQELPVDRIVQNVHAYMNTIFEEEGVPLKPGLVDLLKFLKQNSYRTVVATSSDRVRVDRILKQAGITDYFDDSICGDEVSKGKPDPEIFLKACQKVGGTPETSLVLEDSESGIEAASRAKIPVVCIPDLKEPAKAYADRCTQIFPTLASLIPYLDQQRA